MSERQESYEDVVQAQAGAELVDEAQDGESPGGEARGGEATPPYEKPVLRRYDQIDQVRPYGPSEV